MRKTRQMFRQHCMCISVGFGRRQTSKNASDDDDGSDSDDLEEEEDADSLEEEEDADMDHDDEPTFP